MKIAILNAANPSATLHLETDSYVDYRSGRAACFDGNKCLKPSRSWHGWAYALESEFFVYKKDKWQDCFKYDAIIILVNRNIEEVLPLVKKLKLMKKKVAISFHEGVSDLLGGSGIQGESIFNRWVGLYDLIQEADFFINIFGQMHEFFTGWFGENKVKFVNHGAPIDWTGLDSFKKPFEEREYDVLIGTRTFNQRLSRNTLISLGVLNGLARSLNKKFLFVCEDGDMSGLLSKIGLNAFSCLRGPFSFEEWLKLLGNVKCVAHFDNSLNLGQIAADCAMMDTFCVGSTCWNNLRLGTDDGGDANKLLNLTNKTIYNDIELRVLLNEFKKNLHPDIIKMELMRAFQ